MTKETEQARRDDSGSRTENFLRQEREGGLHPAIKELHQRPTHGDSDTNRRAVEYARIERGRQV